MSAFMHQKRTICNVTGRPSVGCRCMWPAPTSSYSDGACWRPGGTCTHHKRAKQGHREDPGGDPPHTKWGKACLRDPPAPRRWEVAAEPRPPGAALQPHRVQYCTSRYFMYLTVSHGFTHHQQLSVTDTSWPPLGLSAGPRPSPSRRPQAGGAPSKMVLLVT
jgi:hypothetical protein